MYVAGSQCGYPWSFGGIRRLRLVSLGVEYVEVGLPLGHPRRRFSLRRHHDLGMRPDFSAVSAAITAKILAAVLHRHTKVVDVTPTGHRKGGQVLADVVTAKVRA